MYTLHNRIWEFCVMLFVKEKINVMKELPTGKIKVQIKVDSFHFAILQVARLLKTNIKTVRNDVNLFA